MRTTPTFILEQRKHDRGTQFACCIRNHTKSALSLKLPFGVLEEQDMMDDRSFARLLKENRARISMPAGLPPPSPQPPGREQAAPRPPNGQHKAPPTQQPEGDDWAG